MPQQEEALHILLNTLDNLFGEPIGHLSHAAQLQLIKAIVKVCVNPIKKEVFT